MEKTEKELRKNANFNMYHRPVCVKCHVELRPETNGVALVDYFQNNTQPYSMYDADLWKCPSCGIEIITGFGDFPYARHSEEDFLSKIEKAKKSGKFHPCFEAQHEIPQRT